MDEPQEKKVSMVVAVLWIIFLLIVDAIDFILTLLGVGLIANSLINIPVAGAIQLWLTMNGIRGIASLAGSIAEFVPVVNMLPLRTATMIVTIYIANRPIVSKVINAKGNIKSAAGGIKNFRANIKAKGFGGALKDGLTGKTPVAGIPSAPMALQPSFVRTVVSRRITPFAS